MTKVKISRLVGFLTFCMLSLALAERASAATGEDIFLSFYLDTIKMRSGEDALLSFRLDTRRPDLTVLVESLDLGERDIAAGFTEAGQIQIRNDGFIDLNITELTFSGPDVAEFAFDSGATGSPPFNLAPSETLTMTVAFDPSSVGVKNAQINLTTDDPDQASHVIAITGTGIDTGLGFVDKLLLVAGGGDYLGNPIADQTWNLAERFYMVCNSVRGYSADDIQYLSAFETSAENPDVDGVATSQAIGDAVRSWASDATRLTVVLLDHGTHPREGEWFFLVNHTVTPRDSLAASELKTILDDAQSGASAIGEIILIVDMCYSGGFVRVCSGAPEGARRQVFSSTTDERLANFGQSAGLLSFTYFFLSEAAWGNNLYDSFQSARETIVALNVPASAPQLPWFDDDGDGTPSVADGDLARQTYLGTGGAYGALRPEIVDAKENVTLQQPENIQLWCRLSPDVVPSSVQAVLSFGEAQYAAGQPITKYTTVALRESSTPNLWLGNLSERNIRDGGSYNIFYVAIKKDGLPGIDLVSPAVVRTITVSPGFSAVEGRWVLYR